MPSVYAHWSGVCRDTAARRDLLAYIERFAQISHNLFADIPPIIRYQNRITGRILVADGVIPPSVAGAHLTRLNDSLLQLDSGRLEGIEFRLYDGRDLYPGEDRISVVFLRHSDPALDGRLVHVENREACLRAPDPLIQQADWYLAVPHIHLRYYLEEWLDRFMAWVKYFFIPDLSYWRYEDKFPSLQSLAEIINGHPVRRTFRGLIDLFLAEALAWRDTAIAARRLYALGGRPTSIPIP